jgi:quercetin dioxygenase-like cupin family protein
MSCFRSLALLAISIPILAQSRVILDDRMVTVTALELPRSSEYKLESARPHGSVWIALTGGTLAYGADSTHRPIQAGDAAFLPAGRTVSLLSTAEKPMRLVVVTLKQRSQQDLTVQLTTLKPGGELQDASDRNETLLVPISAVRLRDIRNLGDESEWKPSAPDVVGLTSGQVRWIRAGVHHIKNLASSPSVFVTVEW